MLKELNSRERYSSFILIEGQLFSLEFLSSKTNIKFIIAHVSITREITINRSFCCAVLEIFI